MARKKKKLSKKQKQKLVNLAIPMAIILASLLTGVIATLLVTNRAPSNLVWASDNTVKVPRDLVRHLNRQSGCRQYRGTGSPDGIGLWGVYQVSQKKYAKIAYGCSWHLSSYIMAVKDKQGWRLIPPAEYFAPFKEGGAAGNGALPYCSQLEKYKIPKDIESFCIGPDGTAKSNDTP